MKRAHQVPEREARQMRAIEPHLIVAMRNALPSGHPSRVTQAYGISWNTWNKLLNHQPIRHSVALRLLDRIGHDGTLIAQCIGRVTTRVTH